MKKVLFAAAFALCILSAKITIAQVRFSIGVNIGDQPEWGPVGYSHADYYYMPDIDAYYDVSAHNYVYFNNNVWVRSSALPPRYAGYDMYHGYKVVVNHPEPWRNAAMYRSRYGQYRGRHDQNIIRDSRDERYRNHWHGQDHMDNGHRGNYGHDGDHRGDHGRDGNQGHNGDHRGDNGHNGDQQGHGGDHGHDGGHGDGHNH